MDKVLVFETSYGGSIPSKGTALIAQLVEQLPLKQMVLGSSPSGRT